MIQKISLKKGFTLVELLVVISIIGILSSMSIVSVNVARVRARDARRVADMAQVQLALYLYYDDNLSFPVAANSNQRAANWLNVLTPHLSGGASAPDPDRVYMRVVPVDLLNNPPYVYGYYSDGDSFELSYTLETAGPLAKTLSGS